MQNMHNFLLPCASQAGTSLVTTLIGINNGKFKPLKNPTLCNVFMKLDHTKGFSAKFRHSRLCLTYGKF